MHDHSLSTSSGTYERGNHCLSTSSGTKCFGGGRESRCMEESMRCTIVAVTIILGLAASLPAGEYNKTLSVGDAAPTWKDLPGVDGKTHSLADLKDKEVVVVVFTCNSCPVAEAYEDRILAMAKKFGADGKVAVVAINVNNLPEDSLPKMKERAREKSFSFPYLFDKSQKIAREYGATYTPEFFVLNKERKVVYMGAMDDKIKPADVKMTYLDPAIEAALAGKKPAIGETLAHGCRIPYKGER
jgi:peroxiredoxin